MICLLFIYLFTPFQNNVIVLFARLLQVLPLLALLHPVTACPPLWGETPASVTWDGKEFPYNKYPRLKYRRPKSLYIMGKMTLAHLDLQNDNGVIIFLWKTLNLNQYRTRTLYVITTVVFGTEKRTSETGYLMRFQFCPRKLKFSRSTQLTEKSVHCYSYGDFKTNHSTWQKIYAPVE